MARKFPRSRVDATAFKRTETFLRSAEGQFALIEKEHLDREAVALHEIRKLNRTVKQTAERLCLEESPDDPERANAELVKIWKSAELMSVQFDVIEVLANEDLVTLPLNTEIEVYRIFDKCVRIFRPSDRPGRLTLRSQQGYQPTILANDKTFQIIPTALIENALKYSIPGSAISIDVRREGVDCVVKVRNEYAGRAPLTEEIFRRGVRVAKEKEGSGNGLYLAALVAKQHNAYLKVSTRLIGSGTYECIMTVIVPEAKASAEAMYGNDAE